jgi:hypothetical protein
MMRTRRSAAARVVPFAGVALFAAGCGWFGSADVDTLGNRAVALLESLDAQPLDGETFDVDESVVKLDEPYVSAHGIRDDHDTEATIVDLASVLQDDGFDIARNQAVDYSLGHEVLATDGELVIRSFVGAGSDHFTAYPRLDAGSYVVVVVANVGSGPAWTDVDR